MNEEQWKVIPGLERYEISNLARIRLREGKSHVGVPFIGSLSPRQGYVFTRLRPNAGQTKRFSIHRLMAKAWIPNPHNYPQVNHKNGNRSDNRIENLEWCTPSYNVAHSYQLLGRKSPIPKGAGERHPAARLSTEQVLTIRSLRDSSHPQDVATRFGVSRRHVYMIWRGTTRANG